MKIAVTAWENRISPVFDAASRFLIADIQGREIIDRQVVPFNPAMDSHIIAFLTGFNIQVLICGAISRTPATLIESSGILLIPFITGNIEMVLHSYAKGADIMPEFLMPGCGKTCCRRVQNRKRGIHDESENRKQKQRWKKK